MDLREQARRRVACLMMGLSLKEADRLPNDEFDALVEAWNEANGFDEVGPSDENGEPDKVTVHIAEELLDRFIGPGLYRGLRDPDPARRFRL